MPARLRLARLARLGVLASPASIAGIANIVLFEPFPGVGKGAVKLSIDWL